MFWDCEGPQASLRLLKQYVGPRASLRLLKQYVSIVNGLSLRLSLIIRVLYILDVFWTRVSGVEEGDVMDGRLEFYSDWIV